MDRVFNETAAFIELRVKLRRATARAISYK